MTKDIYSALERVIALGCKRVLTSGGENTALEGAPCIAKMVEQADGRITVMPGAISSFQIKQNCWHWMSTARYRCSISLAFCCH